MEIFARKKLFFKSKKRKYEREFIQDIYELKCHKILDFFIL